MKLFGTILYPENRYLTLQFSRGGKNVMCEDYFDNMVRGFVSFGFSFGFFFTWIFDNFVKYSLFLYCFCFRGFVIVKLIGVEWGSVWFFMQIELSTA